MRWLANAMKLSDWKIGLDGQILHPHLETHKPFPCQLSDDNSIGCLFNHMHGKVQHEYKLCNIAN